MNSARDALRHSGAWHCADLSSAVAAITGFATVTFDSYPPFQLSLDWPWKATPSSINLKEWDIHNEQQTQAANPTKSAFFKNQ